MRVPDQNSAGAYGAALMAVELEHHDDGVENGYHVIPHPFYGWVQAQIFNKDGALIPTPGASRAWQQKPGSGRGTIQVDRVYTGYYPLTVVIVGCELFRE